MSGLQPPSRGHDAAAPKISFRGVEKTYGGRGRHRGTLALDRFDLEIGKTEILSIVGPTGCGKSTALNYQRAARSIGLTPTQTFFRIVLPGALPQIFTGLKVALALSWAVVVAAELVGAQTGLGFMISDAALLFRLPVVFIGIALIGLIGLVMNLTLNFAEARIVHWRGR